MLIFPFDLASIMEGKEKTNMNHSSSILPPGFRFHPTDEELIVHYLRNQAMSKPCPVSIIQEVDIYKFDPWQLPEKTEFGGNEWYFFTPRDRKYPNGVRPNRATLSGYWKATGTDKPIYSAARYVGIKKALVFYKGKPSKGTKTDWMMHEYRLNEPSRAHHQIRPHGSMRLDDWVLCRIYKKRHTGKALDEQKEEDDQGLENLQVQQTPRNLISTTTAIKNEHGGRGGGGQPELMMKFPRTFSLAELAELDCLGPVSHLLNYRNGSFHGTSFELQSNIMWNSGFDPNGSGSSLFGDLGRIYH